MAVKNNDAKSVHSSEIETGSQIVSHLIMNHSSISPATFEFDSKQYIKVKQIKKFSFIDKIRQFAKQSTAVGVGTSPDLPVSALSNADKRPSPELKNQVVVHDLKKKLRLGNQSKVGRQDTVLLYADQLVSMTSVSPKNLLVVNTQNSNDTLHNQMISSLKR